MKKAIIILAALASLLACRKDPLAEVKEGSWNHDRQILEILFCGQAGTAEIEMDENSGTISLQILKDSISDLSKIRINSLVLSYKATASCAAGDCLDFSGEDPHIIVSSPNGEKRDYSVHMEMFEETLKGFYAIKEYWVYGGTGTDYGGSAIMRPELKSWCWSSAGFGPTADYDDYLEITLTDILSNGNTTGECFRYGGANGRHWDCTLVATMNKEGDGPVDLHNFYRQIPIGHSRWVRDYAKGTVTFTDDKGRSTSGQFIPKGQYLVGKKGSTDYIADVTTTDAFHFTLKGVDDWVNIFNDYDKFVKRPRNFFMDVDRVEAIPEEAKTIGKEN